MATIKESIRLKADLNETGSESIDIGAATLTIMSSVNIVELTLSLDRQFAMTEMTVDEETGKTVVVLSST